MVPWAAQVAVAVLSAALAAALLLWALRYLRYREQAKLAHARWLAYEPPASVVYAGSGSSELGVRWPMLAPAMLSPIPEERPESGRESEQEAMISARKDARANSVSAVAYGSFDHPA